MCFEEITASYYYSFFVICLVQNGYLQSWEMFSKLWPITLFKMLNTCCVVVVVNKLKRKYKYPNIVMFLIVFDYVEQCYIYKQIQYRIVSTQNKSKTHYDNYENCDAGWLTLRFHSVSQNIFGYNHMLNVYDYTPISIRIILIDLVTKAMVRWLGRNMMYVFHESKLWIRCAMKDMPFFWTATLCTLTHIIIMFGWDVYDDVRFWLHINHSDKEEQQVMLFRKRQYDYVRLKHCLSTKLLDKYCMWGSPLNIVQQIDVSCQIDVDEWTTRKIKQSHFLIVSHQKYTVIVTYNCIEPIIFATAAQPSEKT